MDENHTRKSMPEDEIIRNKVESSDYEKKINRGTSEEVQYNQTNEKLQVKISLILNLIPW